MVNRVMVVQVEESTGQQAKATGRSRGRSSRAVNPHLAGPTSPAASRDSGAGKHAKLASPYAATSQRYLDTGSSYSQVPPYMTPHTSPYTLHDTTHHHTPLHKWAFCAASPDQLCNVSQCACQSFVCCMPAVQQSFIASCGTLKCSKMFKTVAK